jgi:hypothetical protein
MENLLREDRVVNRQRSHDPLILKQLLGKEFQMGEIKTAIQDQEKDRRPPLTLGRNRQNIIL